MGTTEGSGANSFANGARGANLLRFLGQLLNERSSWWEPLKVLNRAPLRKELVVGTINGFGGSSFYKGAYEGSNELFKNEAN